MALLPTSASLTDSSTTNAQQKTNFTAIRTFLADLLGTDSSNKVASRTALDCGQGVYGSRGLTGKVNATTPLTKYDISADAVVLRNATGGTTTQYSVAAITCDLGLTGSAANGRDQSAAFTASSWVYVYFIWNGSTMATLSSLSAPPTAPTLPSGYTHWCFATAIRWNASSNITPMFTRGNTCYYDVTEGGFNRVLSAGVSTVAATIGLTSLVPPSASSIGLNLTLSLIHNIASTSFIVQMKSNDNSMYRRTISLGTQVAGVICTDQNYTNINGSSTQQISYSISAVPSGAGGLYIDVMDFSIPNGAM